VHHILVDGYSWYSLLKTTSSLLSGQTVAKQSSFRIMDLSNYLYYQWNTIQRMQDQYRVYSVTADIEDTMSYENCIEIIRQTLICNPVFKNYTLLCDWDGRYLMPNNTTNGLGCYSIMIPVIVSGALAKIQIQQVISAKKVCIPSKQLLRINFLGNLEDMLLSIGLSSSNEYLQLCIKENLYYCSGYGCDAEITVLTSENRLGATCTIYISSRSSMLSDDLILSVLSQIGDAFRKTSDESLSFSF
jgi:hypothetical protein